MLGNRADPGLSFNAHQQKTHIVDPFGNNLHAGCSLTRNRYGGAAESGFWKQRGELLYLSLLITLLINNYKLYHSFTYKFANK